MRDFHSARAAERWALKLSRSVRVTVLVEVVVKGGVDRAEFLQALHLPEPQHGPLSSSERLV